MVGDVDSDDLDYRPLPPKGRLVVMWPLVIVGVVMHLMFFHSIYMTIFRIPIATTLWTLTYGYVCFFSITIGAHRLYSHKSFKAHPLLRLVLVWLFAANGQYSTFSWVLYHRLHHKYTETDADPYNAQRGFFYCHAGWTMCRKQPEMVEKERKIDMSDLEADPYVMFQYRYYALVYTFMGIVVPVTVPYFLWGETLFNSFMSGVVFRTVLGYHVTSCVNSVAHMYGTRPYTKTIKASEVPLLSIFALGEAWHNYHHTFPWDYRASEFGQKFNYSTAVIDVFHKLGWVWDLRHATPDMVHHRVLRHGDGTHPLGTSKTTKLQ